MKTEIEIWNGSGWNNYTALRTLKTLKVGSRGLAAKQGISKIEVAPRDSERPFGIAARYYDADGELMFTEGFDQNDGAEYIRECVFHLLSEGVQNRINARQAEINHTARVNRITAWRRNWDAVTPISRSIDKLSVKFHNARRAAKPELPQNVAAHYTAAQWQAYGEIKQPSRKLCTTLARQVTTGEISYADAVAKITSAGGKF